MCCNSDRQGGAGAGRIPRILTIVARQHSGTSNIKGWPRRHCPCVALRRRLAAYCPAGYVTCSTTSFRNAGDVAPLLRVKTNSLTPCLMIAGSSAKV